MQDEHESKDRYSSDLYTAYQLTCVMILGSVLVLICCAVLWGLTELGILPKSPEPPNEVERIHVSE